FQLRDQGQRFGVRVVHVEDDQRRLLFAILFHVIQKIFFSFAEFYFDVEFARYLLNLSREKKIIHESKDARVGVSAIGERLGFRWRIGRSEAGASAASRAGSVVAAHSGAIVVIHGSGVNAATLLTVAAGLSATIGRTSSAPPSISPSASGGMSGSYHYVSLFFGNLFFD